MRALVLSVLLTTAAAADVIHLKRGDTIEVDAWRETKGIIYYQRFGGEVGILNDDVLMIEKKGTDPTIWQSPGARQSPTTPTVVDPALPGGTAAPAAQTKAARLAYWQQQKEEALQGMQQTDRLRERCQTDACREAASSRHLVWAKRWLQATREYDAAAR